MASVLLYNIRQKEKLGKIKFILFKLGIALREVSPEEFNASVGSLLGLDGLSEPQEDACEPFTDEMLVMYGLSSGQFNALLSALRQNRVPVALKAVVTETNACWSSARLHRELNAEHAAMSGLRPRDAAKNSAHKK